MNLVYAEVVEILIEDGMRMGRIKVGGAVKKVPLDLLTDARCRLARPRAAFNRVDSAIAAESRAGISRSWSRLHGDGLSRI
jgi:hypothetical protein